MDGIWMCYSCFQGGWPERLERRGADRPLQAREALPRYRAELLVWHCRAELGSRSHAAEARQRGLTAGRASPRGIRVKFRLLQHKEFQRRGNAWPFPRRP
jgi:hypothetical protein